MENNRFYRNRNKPFTAQDDLAWLLRAREELRKSCTLVFPVGQWPLRAAKMDRVMRALGALQHTLHEAISEVRAELGVRVEDSHDPWLGYPWPRR
jgi:hypothetical protein